MLDWPETDTVLPTTAWVLSRALLAELNTSRPQSVAAKISDPSLEYATELATVGPVGMGIVASFLWDETFQTSTMATEEPWVPWIEPPTARVVPSGENAMVVNATFAALLRVVINNPVVGFHNSIIPVGAAAAPDSPQLARIEPSGE